MNDTPPFDEADVDDDDLYVPVGWELVTLTDEEQEELWEAADRGDQARAEEIVDAAYARLFGEYVN